MRPPSRSTRDTRCRPNRPSSRHKASTLRSRRDPLEALSNPFDRPFSSQLEVLNDVQKCLSHHHRAPGRQDRHRPGNDLPPRTRSAQRGVFPAHRPDPERRRRGSQHPPHLRDLRHGGLGCHVRRHPGPGRTAHLIPPVRRPVGRDPGQVQGLRGGSRFRGHRGHQLRGHHLPLRVRPQRGYSPQPRRAGDLHRQRPGQDARGDHLHGQDLARRTSRPRDASSCPPS